MIDQSSSIRRDSIQSSSQPNNIHIQYLKQQNRDSNDNITASEPVQQQQYFQNEISNDKDRNILLERIIRNYEQQNSGSPSGPSSPAEGLSTCNSRDSLASLGAAHLLPTINKKRFILNDTSSYSPTLLPATNKRHKHEHYNNNNNNNNTTQYSKQTNFLKPSMVFTGYQISGYKRYQVTVTLNTVDFPLHNTNPDIASIPHMTGVLSIKGLTYHQEEISTFFESFAVTDNNYGFLSSSFKNHHHHHHHDHDLLNLTSNDVNDMQHWLNFPAFKEMFQIDHFNTLSQVKTPNYIKDYLNERYIFMRWKEKFLIDDPEVNAIEGASFDGYYYIVHDQFTGNIQGFYYHKDAEIFQQLELLPYAKIPGNSSFDFA